MLTRQKEISDLISCSYQNWYDDFKKNSIKSFILQIPAAVLNYLKQDFFILPKECQLVGSSSDTGYVGEGTDFDEEDSEEADTPEFPEFSKTIADTLKLLGGSAFVKTNWHCPQDSIWITAGQTLKAIDITDVYQLLKASSICKEDLNQVEQEGFYYLVLKKWKEIHPGTEFRCFVKNKNLIAISPRDWPQYHEHFKTQRQDIIKDIVSLFKEKIKEKFPIDNYCFDVIRATKDHVTIVDFSPFNKTFTASLAFEWNQLEADAIITNDDDEPDDPEFRYLDSDVGIQPNSRNNYGIPHDIINMYKASSTTDEGNLNDEQLANISRLVIDQLQDETRDQAED